jgi:hypothetical protein
MMQRHASRRSGHEAADWVDGPHTRPRRGHPGVGGGSCEHRHRDLGRDARRALPGGWACGRVRRSRSGHPGVGGGSCEHRHRDLGRDARRALPGELTGARFFRHSPGADDDLIDRHVQSVHWNGWRTAGVRPTARRRGPCEARAEQQTSSLLRFHDLSGVPRHPSEVVRRSQRANPQRAGAGPANCLGLPHEPHHCAHRQADGPRSRRDEAKVLEKAYFNPTNEHRGARTVPPILCMRRSCGGESPRQLNQGQTVGPAGQ